MENILEQVIQYVNAMLEDLNCYLNEIPPEILWAVAGFFILLFLVMQIRKFSAKRKKNKAALQYDKIEESDQGLEALIEEEDLEEAEEEIRKVEPPDSDETGPLEVDETEVLEQVEEITAEPEPEGFFSRLKNGLSKTRNTFAGGLDRIFSGAQKIDDDLMEEIEELLITSDIQMD